ncbi:XrtA/PEP-CTERM system TPR-repeat protein PrsT [Alteromonas flava]|uniref:XrtA/PEP-CTERM system TPR-repeat protein PrsT n=1 Tax=Alteromonas flava TaxID=2048003 RepID=UPI000C282F04|nr:XrtA/PEP-CTERM system TPR-repeat protein PrsT [Alteromonas flava]
MQRRNKALTISLTGLALAVSLSLSGCSKKTPEEHISAAQAYIQQDNTKAAIVELKNAIQLNPKATEARVQLGKLYLAQSDFASAEKELQRALDNGHPPAQVIPFLSQAYRRTGAVNALAEVDHQMAELTPAEQVEVGFFKLQSLVELGDIEQARALTDELLKVDTNSAYLGLVKVVDAVLQDDNAAALAIAQDTYAQAPLNRDALLTLARLQLQANDNETAIATYAEYLSAYPEDSNTKFMLASLLVELGKTEQAEPYVDDLLELAEKNPMLNQLKGIILSEKGQFERAYGHLETALDAGSSDPVLRLVAGYAAFQLKDYESANLHLSLIAPQLPDDHAGLKLLAASQLQLGMANDASASLQRLQTQNSEDASLFSRAGYELAKAGNIADAKTMLQRTQQLGDGTENLLRTGILQLSLNQVEGIINLEQAAEQAPDSVTAQSTLATAYLATGQLDKATELADNWKATSPNEPQAYLLAAEIAQRNDDNAAALAEYQQALQLAPNDSTVLLAHARFIAQQGDTSGGIAGTQKVLQQSPGNPNALALLYLLEREQGNTQNVFALINQQLQAKPNDVDLRLLLARMQATDGELDAALASLSRIAPGPTTPRDFWQLKGQTLVQLGQFADAEQHFEQWISLFPYDKNAALGMLLMLDMSGGIDKALAITKQFLEKRQDPQIQLLRAHFFNLKPDVAASRTELTKLPEAVASTPFAQGVKARNFLAERRFAEAVEPARVAYTANNSLRNLFNLLAALEGAGDTRAGYELLLAHAQENPDDLRARMLLAERKIQQDSSAAIKEYAALAEADPTNYVALNNLAYLLMQEKDLDSALTYAERALELAPDNPAVADTLAQIYRAQGKVDEALAEYDRVVNSQMRNEEIFLNYIETLLIAGNSVLAQRRLDQRTMELPTSQQTLARLAEQYGIRIDK